VAMFIADSAFHFECFEGDSSGAGFQNAS